MSTQGMSIRILLSSSPTNVDNCRRSQPDAGTFPLFQANRCNDLHVVGEQDCGGKIMLLSRRLSLFIILLAVQAGAVPADSISERAVRVDRAASKQGLAAPRRRIPSRWWRLQKDSGAARRMMAVWSCGFAGSDLGASLFSWCLVSPFAGTLGPIIKVKVSR